jgi:hypothetical protein
MKALRSCFFQSGEKELQRVSPLLSQKVDVRWVEQLQKRVVIRHSVFPKQVGFPCREGLKVLDFPDLEPELRAIGRLELV